MGKRKSSTKSSTSEDIPASADRADAVVSPAATSSTKTKKRKGADKVGDVLSVSSVRVDNRVLCPPCRYPLSSSLVGLVAVVLPLPPSQPLLLHSTQPAAQPSIWVVQVPLDVSIFRLGVSNVNNDDYYDDDYYDDDDDDW